MNIYSVKVPLRYGSIPYSGENPNFQQNSFYALDQPIECHYCISIESDNTALQQKSGTARIRNEENVFQVEMDAIWASDENKAISKTHAILENICQNLSFMAQKHQGDLQFFYPGFYWLDREIKLYLKKNNADDVIEKENKDGMTTLLMKDSISVYESLEITCSYTLMAEDFSRLNQIKASNSFFRFMLKAYYGALMDSDISSKYFRLFTIIEYLEQNFISKEPWEKLIPEVISERVLEDFISSVKKRLQDSGRGEKFAQSRSEKIKSRLSSTVKTATMESRAEKLFCYLSEHYEIQTVRSIGASYPLTLEIVKELINQRNRLFHGNEKDKDQRELMKLTRYLLFLCQNIIEKISGNTALYNFYATSEVDEDGLHKN